MAENKAGQGNSIDLGVFGFMTTPIRSAFKMAGQVVGQIIPGIKPDTPFSPLQPLPPINQNERRAFDYQVGTNISYIPRAQEPISAEQLRNLSYNSWVVRGAIETAKDELSTLKYQIRWRDKKKNKKGGNEDDPVIKNAMDILRKPDRRLTWTQWSRILAEDILVIDAPAYEIWRDKAGRPIGFLNIDGATIKTLVGKDGRTPFPPDPAYQQIIKGAPWSDFTTDELIYYPRNLRSNKLYGYSPVEQIVLMVNAAIRRDVHLLQWFTEGTCPDAIVSGPAGLGATQLREFQEYFDFLMNDTAMRRKVTFFPDGSKWEFPKQAIIENSEKFDEYIARVVTWIFSVSVQPLVKEMNRATAEAGKRTATETGLEARKITLQEMMNRGLEAIDPGLEFVFMESEDVSASTQAIINASDVKSGISTIDEIRAKRGDDPLGPEWQDKFIPGANRPMGGPGDQDPFGDQGDGQDQNKDDSTAAMVARLKKKRSDYLREGYSPRRKPAA